MHSLVVDSPIDKTIYYEVSDERASQGNAGARCLTRGDAHCCAAALGCAGCAISDVPDARSPTDTGVTRGDGHCALQPRIGVLRGTRKTECLIQLKKREDARWTEGRETKRVLSCRRGTRKMLGLSTCRLLLACEGLEATSMSP